MRLCWPGTMFVFGTFGMCGTFGTFGTCLAPDCSEHLAQISQNLTQIRQNQPKSPKATMLKFGDVSFDLGFERGRMSATGYVAKISMIKLNIGSGKLSSWMLSIGRGPKAVQGKGEGCPPLPCSHLDPRPMLSMHELSLPEPMLSLSMLILATYPLAALDVTIRDPNQN